MIIFDNIDQLWVEKFRLHSDLFRTKICAKKLILFLDRKFSFWPKFVETEEPSHGLAF
mgnify:CR=1 FL=1